MNSDLTMHSKLQTGAVVWVTLFATVALYALIGIASPETTLDHEVYKRFQTNNDYWGCRPDYVTCTRQKRDGKAPSEDEVTAIRLNEYARELRNERRNSQQLATKAAVCILGGLLAIAWSRRTVNGMGRAESLRDA
jgi:hypothetical protein